MRENSIKGLLTELKCQETFTSIGYMVSQPICPDSKYDFVVDIENCLYKIQCKSASLSKDKSYIVLRTKSTNIRTMKDSYYTKKDIDYFYTYYNNTSYLIPVEEAGHGETRLRFSSSQPNNPNIKWASNYEFGTMIKKIKEEVDN